jgi:hypothetical protein
MPDFSTDPIDDQDAIFEPDGPLDPLFMLDAIQTIMRATPLDTGESEAAMQRHMHTVITALSATNPRDPIEVMLAVQAICAYNAASACWRIGMNLRQPHGDSTRHITTAATAARTFDTMLRAIERRQVKPLSVPVGRPARKTWPKDKVAATIDSISDRLQKHDEGPAPPEPAETMTWTPEQVAYVNEFREKERIERENEGLDIANTEGILPGGGMILPEDPTPQQAAYMGRRLKLMYMREIAENRRLGIKTKMKIRPIKTGDLIP